MENKFAKVSAYKNNIVVDLKRKRANSTVNFMGASDKWRRVDDGCVYLPSKSLEKYHSNFMKSGIPKRLMYYQHENGAWVDFPDHTLDLIKENFQIKKGTMELKWNGECFALDFLHMIQIDLQTGFQQRIAWIDESDSCYFPENFAEFCSYSFAKECDHQSEPQESSEIKLHLSIEINKEDTPIVKESNDIPDAKEGDNFVEAGVPREFETRHHLDLGTVRQMFYDGYFLHSADIVDISRNPSSRMEARFELFLKQVEIMQKYRGDANVQYAWLPSSKALSSAVMDHGLGFSIPSKIKPVYGIGTYLIPTNFTETCANYCDIDENGEQCMILCRVILGNTELIHPGSKQFHPYTEEFDSGVDDTHYPSHYIVWNMNAATHIYPEYVVTFKFIFDSEEDSEESESTDSALGDEASIDDVPEDDVESESIASVLTSEQGSTGGPQERAPNMAVMRGPRSPWVPFPLLFDVIANRVPENEMDVVLRNFEIFKSGQMTRDEFVRHLRIIVGDALLRETVINCQHPYPANPAKDDVGTVVQNSGT